MKIAATIRIVAWSILGVFLIVILVGGINGGLPLFSFGSSFYYEHSDRYTPGNGSLPANQVGAIDINWVGGSVNVEEHAGSDVVFSETSGGSLDEKEQMQYYLDGERLIIQYCAPNGRIWSRDSARKELTVLVPTGHPLARLELESVSATVNATGISASELRAETVSGSVSLDGVSASKLDLEGVSGDLTTRNTAANELSVENVSGGTDLEGSFGRIEGETVSGSLTVAPGSAVSFIDLESVSGGITITLPEDMAGFTLNHSSVSGGVECDFPVDAGRHSITYLGGGGSFDVETVSGPIQVRKG